MRQNVLNLYKKYRKHQLSTYQNSGLYYNGKDQRQFTGGGAAYGEHAKAAYFSSLSHLHFVYSLKNKEKDND